MGKVEFGVMLRQERIDFPSIREGAELCDELGFHSLWFYDHLLGMGLVEQDILESWTLMSALSTVTEKAKLGTMVLCNSFRPPALLAKMAATLDNITDGRLEFAIGGGWFEPEFKGYGYDFSTTRTRIERLAESVRIIRSLWTEEKTTFKGKHYSIEDAYCNPKPVQKPHPPITIGGAGEKYLLRVVAELADCWNCPATDADKFERKLDVLARHCADFDRDVSDITISEQTVCVIAKDKEELAEKLVKAKRRYGFFGDIEKIGIVGTPEECIRRIQAKTAKGVSKFTIFFSDMLKPGMLRLFAEEVIPEFN